MQSASALQARLKSEELSAGAIEAGVRALAASSPARAFSTLQELLLQGKDKHVPDADSTLPLLFKELSKAVEQESFWELVRTVEPALCARCKVCANPGSLPSAKQAQSFDLPRHTLCACFEARAEFAWRTLGP